MMKHFSPSSFITGVVLGALLAGAWFLGDSVPAVSLVPTKQSSSLTATSTSSIMLESSAISVTDQIAGDTVIVESVTVPPPGVWIAVREMNGSDLGNVLGALRVDGPRAFVPVSLLRATETGKSYAVELYRDDNNGAFDPATNSVYVDFNTGAPVIANFTTTP